MKAVLLAGGKGKRLAPYTTVLPKPLLPVGEMPILEVVVRQLKGFGVQEFTFCVGYLGSLLEAYFGSGSRWGVQIQYSYEKTPLGTAGPLALIKDQFSQGDPFLVMNGDLLTTLRFDRMLEFHRGHGGEATIGLYKKKSRLDLGLVEIEADGRLKNYIEKPDVEHLVSMGIYIFNASICERVQKYADLQGKLDLPDLMLKMKTEDVPAQTYLEDCEWLDIGRPEDYSTAVQIFDEKKSSYLPKYEANISN